MASEYGFEKKTIRLLMSGIFVLFILVFCLGLLIGLSVERKDDTAQKKLKIAHDSEIKPVEAAQGDDVKQEKNKTVLAKETESRPVSPEFSETAPTAELPKISRPQQE
ncbi:hypothetical protein KKA14_00045 [bacterium]|nr:hypothetical protein [bacterium]